MIQIGQLLAIFGFSRPGRSRQPSRSGLGATNHSALHFFFRCFGRRLFDFRASEPPDQQKISLYRAAVNDQLRNSLLLLAQMIPKQPIARDVSGVYAGQRVIHQKVGVEFSKHLPLRERTIALPQIIAPFGRTSRSSLCSTRYPGSLSAGNNHDFACSNNIIRPHLIARIMHRIIGRDSGISNAFSSPPLGLGM